jgi:hypothetical protein
MHQSSSSAAKRHPTDQEIPHLLLKTKVHYCAHTASRWHKSTATRIQSLVSRHTSLRFIIILCSKIHFSITITPSPWSLKWILPPRFSKNILVHNSHVRHIQHTLQYYQSPLHDQPNNIQYTPHIMKLCTVQFLQPPETSYTLSSNTFLSLTPSNTTNPLGSPNPILHPSTYLSLSTKHIQSSL